MARERLCKICGGWHDLDKPWPGNCLPEYNDTRSHLATPMIIHDGMQPIRSMADGKIYTSKAAMRQSYKPSGNPEGKRYVEVGDQVSTKLAPKPRPDRKAIEATVAKAFSQAGLGA